MNLAVLGDHRGRQWSAVADLVSVGFGPASDFGGFGGRCGIGGAPALSPCAAWCSGLSWGLGGAAAVGYGPEFLGAGCPRGSRGWVGDRGVGRFGQREVTL